MLKTISRNTRISGKKSISSTTLQSIDNTVEKRCWRQLFYENFGLRTSNRKLVMGCFIAGIVAIAGIYIANNYYYYIIPSSVDFDLVSKRGTIEIKVPGRYLNILPNVPRKIARERLKGGPIESVPLLVPFTDMPIISEYSLIGKSESGDDKGLLTLWAGSASSIQEINIRMLESKKTILDYKEVPSDVKGYKKYISRNNAELSPSFALLSEKYLIECARNCSFRGIYNPMLSFTYMFPKSEIPNIDKIDASVRAMIDRFVDTAKN